MTQIELPEAVPVEGTRFRLAVVEVATSTNTVLAEAAHKTVDPWYVLRADHQTAGHGRQGRMWESPPGAGMLLSILFDSRPVEQVHLLSTAVGFATAAACRTLGANARMQWPNDLVGPHEVDGHTAKLAGVLGQLVESPYGMRAVIGVGLNLRSQPGLAETIGRPVTVLDDLVGSSISADEMAHLVLGSLELVLAALDDPARGPAWLRQQCIEISATIGHQISVATQQGTFEGKAIDIDVDGHLVLETDDGPRTFEVGDIDAA
ncbi:MAG: biotin--[acetyl-CoA-carboxylase] ligase [Actinomycetia bacterium]|nr:biotin--[acetyl-CoA-carboxylase] ligase [Actinomycetes bacterium]MCP4961431.1 biotin--[acetyl-CoA-carboxylase] ligase [Actinomycetes bacterium]